MASCKSEDVELLFDRGSQLNQQAGFFHPSINYFIHPSIFSIQGHRVEPPPAVTGQKQGDTLDQPTVHRNSRLKCKQLFPILPDTYVFGLWEEAIEPRENPHRH